ncbi:hypothetical protein HNP38_002932 [Chryseobacterium defluvii]|uniref:Lipoprotein n=1 Tax=Chryseobacterium defluvii TaxID=160396 RepID=A0A840KEL7_9FLAO|nr:hypothetical protein [Chryseobacterium defluvii]MBB4807626.1 hypothetical protein [Chryseobacterium defluvii]
MKKLLTLLFAIATLISCSRKEAQAIQNQADSAKIIDSINAVRIKMNDSISAKNSTNRFKDFNGDHKFTHNLIKQAGSVNFRKIDDERDTYQISGGIKSGKDRITIDGYMKVVSDKHMNFTGTISESISENDNGKPYSRKGTRTFLSKDGGKSWRLQDMVNGSGFVDYIDIHF